MSEKNPAHNPHDAYFKATFGKVDFAKDFLNNYLPVELVHHIDIEKLTPEPTSYLSKELKEQFTDLVYKAEIKGEKAYITLLLEHKSYPDRMVIFQVLKYIITIWEEKTRNDMKSKKAKNTSLKTSQIELPIIIPLVIYHDKNKWKIKRSLGEMIPHYKTLPDIIKKHIPNYEYLLIDLSPSPKYDKINLAAEHAIVIETLSQARFVSKEQVIEIFIRALIIYSQAKEKDIATYYISETIIYIISIRDDISETELKNIANQVSKEGGELIMTLAERLIERGRQEARQEAMTLAERLREEGIEKNQREMAKKLLRMGISTEQVAEASELPLGEILELKEEIKN